MRPQGLRRPYKIEKRFKVLGKTVTVFLYAGYRTVALTYSNVCVSEFVDVLGAPLSVAEIEGLENFSSRFRISNYPIDHSVPSLQRAKQWMEACAHDHPLCNDTKSPQLPTRLLLINDEKVQLVLTAKWNVRAPHATLSHCWHGPLLEEHSSVFRKVSGQGAVTPKFSSLGALIFPRRRLTRQHAPSQTDRHMTMEFPTPISGPKPGALQERLLAPRTLHFGEGDLFWECRTKGTCESFLVGLHKRSKFTDFPRSRGILRETWQEIIQPYSQGQLTYRGDNLVALAGIARMAQHESGDEYVAGLWRKRMEELLCWRRRESCSREEGYRAPSWSWASLDGNIEYREPDHLRDEEPELFSRVSDVCVLPSGPDPFGQLIDGVLALEYSRILPAMWFEDRFALPYRDNIKISVADFTMYGSMDLERDMGKTAVVEIVPLVRSKKGSEDTIKGLILQSAGVKKGEFKRRESSTMRQSLKLKVSFAAAGLVATALSQLSSVPSATNVVPYADGSCTVPLTNFTYTAQTQESPGFTLGGGVEANRGWTEYDNLVFQGAAVPDNGPGYGVYWNPGPIGPGCRAIFMTSFIGGADYDQVVSPQAPGNVILNVGKEGCYYTNLAVDATLMMTFCCGTGDCTPYAAGNQQITSRDLDHLYKPKKREPEPVPEAAPIEEKKEGILERGLSLAARASKLVSAHREEKRTTTCASNDMACLQQFWSQCTFDMGSSYQAAGPQVALSAALPCQAGVAGGTCSISSALSFTSGTSINTQTSTTLTSTAGFSVSVTSGVIWPVDATATVGVNYSFAVASEKSSGTTISNSSTVAVTSTAGIVNGMTAFLSFSPSYTCYEPIVTCGSTEQTIAVVCNPNMDANNNPQGETILLALPASRIRDCEGVEKGEILWYPDRLEKMDLI
ncbi:hypothetical protein G7Y89_g14890 [Cudoniella acicularis]|uniref:Uncharacterized protein n=1 Tax=Cudoniella acicularis TaxID=354080 RepID=A0A8H4QWC8_9HELO|nr:hypothetical protein G7Y89_g14890 [Cudoniella acicularis]